VSQPTLALIEDDRVAANDDQEAAPAAEAA